MQSFELAPRLAADGHKVLDWPLCRVLLMGDARYPWFILVPLRPALRELCQLSAPDEQQFWRESRALSQWLLDELQADKLNIAALGNVEPQLHIHHVARYRDDAAWPAPIWGAHPPQPYTDKALQALLQHARQGLGKALSNT